MKPFLPVILCLMFIVTAVRSRGAEPVDVGDRKQLFIDKRLVESSEGVRLVMGAPVKRGEPVMRADKPWEKGGLNHFEVLRVDGEFRMWYEAWPVHARLWQDTGLKVHYARSADGLVWEKPDIGGLESGGIRAENAVFAGPQGKGAVGISVFLDPTAPAEERFKMVFGDVGEAGYPLRGAYSPDGLKWETYREKATGKPVQILPQGADTQNAAYYDKDRGRYVVFTRHNVRRPNEKYNPEGIRRVARSESEEFLNLPKGTQVLAMDEKDPRYSGWYTMAATPYPYAEDVYVAFPSFFPDERHQKGSLVEVHLAVSRDGIHWERPSREPFLPLGPAGEFDSRMIFMSPGVHRVGNELWMYYAGYPVNHAEHSPSRDTGVAYGLATIRLDGFVAAKAGPEGGFLTTPPLVFSGDKLKLNVDLGAAGSVRVSIIDPESGIIPGFSGDKMKPVYGNHIAAEVNWEGDPDLAGLAGRPVQLRFDMQRGSLYAFQ
ncbi:MAG: hypothetical protein KY475_18890, partial [Planctomycetes bacterium]|nr:hypothetical protein [Planctomycetota bacterium]